MREQIFEAFGAAVKAFATGHAVFGVRAFVAFVAGENIQVCTVELDAMRGNLGEIAAYVVRCELDRKSTRLNSSHSRASRMPSSA